MKITLLTTNNSRSAGGLYNSVRNLGLSIYHKGIDLDLLSCNDKFSTEDLPAYEDLPMSFYEISQKPLLRQLGYSKNIMDCIKQRNPDIIHSQGLWMYNSAASFKSRKFGCKTVISPRGALDEWALKTSPLKKRIVGYWFEYGNLWNADCMHALCESEYLSMRSFGLKNPIAIIPNGVLENQTFQIKHYEKKRKVLLFIGRLHEKKGITPFLTALSQVKSQTPNLFDNWEVRIAGWGDEQKIANWKNQLAEGNLENDVFFIGSVVGGKKENELQNADAFILPSFSEGMPMAVLEAWTHRLPVIMTDACNIPSGFEANAAIRVTPEASSIKEGVIKAFTMPKEELEAIGQNGFDLVNGNFTWNKIADQTIELYQWLMGECDKPSFVVTD